VKKLEIISLLILIFGIFFFVFKYVLAGSLVWKTYQNPTVAFTFKYPSGWFICEEFYPNLDQYFVHIYVSDVNCEELPYEVNSLNIAQQGRMIQETDIKTYLLRLERESFLEEKQNLKQGRPPFSPGFYWQFVKYEKGLFLTKGSSVARVLGLGKGDNRFVVLHGNYLYEIIASTFGRLKSLPFRLILWTVRFK